MAVYQGVRGYYLYRSPDRRNSCKRHRTGPTMSYRHSLKRQHQPPFLRPFFLNREPRIDLIYTDKITSKFHKKTVTKANQSWPLKQMKAVADDAVWTARSVSVNPLPAAFGNLFSDAV